MWTIRKWNITIDDFLKIDENQKICYTIQKKGRYIWKKNYGIRLEATDQNAQYDACAKRILGNKQILAHIIKAAIPGFQDMKPSEIIPYIEGEP